MPVIHQFVISDGQLVPAEGFKIPEEGTILYEVIRITNDIILFPDDHLTRLERSAELAEVRLPFSGGEIRAQVELLIQANHVGTGNIQLIFQYEQGISKHQAIFFIPHHYPSEAEYLNGVNTILYRAAREKPNAKIIQQELRNQINQMIAQEHAYEAILVHPDGYITEGSRSNFFMIRDSTVCTAPEADVLPGITRKYVLLICEELSIPLVEERIDVQELSQMDAAFISGTSPKILPVAQTDHFRFNPANTTLRKIMQRYDELLKG